MQAAQTAFSNIMNPSQYNPYMPPMYAPQPAPVQMVPQKGYNANNNSSASIL